MNNQEILATFGTQDTERTQTKLMKSPTQHQKVKHQKLKRLATRITPKT